MANHLSNIKKNLALKSSLTARMFWKVFHAQLIGLLINNINTIIDSLITSNVLGPASMSAVGLFGPLGNLFMLFYIFNMGTTIICSEYTGRGDTKSADSLFTSCILFQAVLGLVLGGLSFAFSEPLALLLGANQETLAPLVGYIRGYSIGVSGLLLFNLFLSFLQLNDMLNWTYIGILFMAIVNLALNLLFSLWLGMGLFGIGLATSISTLAATILVLFRFTGKRKRLIHLRYGGFDLRNLMSAAKHGLPQLAFNIGLFIKSYIINVALLALGLRQALAVVTVHNTVCGFLAIIPVAVSGAVLLISAIFYGEENAASLKSLLKYSLKAGTLLCLFCAAAVMLLSGPISSAYYAQGTELWAMTREMLLVFPCFIIFNVIFFVCARVHQTTGHIQAINVLSFFETVICGLYFWLLSLNYGLNGAWYAYSYADITSIIALAVFVFIVNRRITFRAGDWLLLDEKKQFAPPEKRTDITVSENTSWEQLFDSLDGFIRKSGVLREKANKILLFVEEIFKDISARNAKLGGKEVINLHLSLKDDNIRLLIRDNGKLSDPKDRDISFSPDAPMRNVEIRIVAGMTNIMMYHNILGMNVMYLEF